MDEYAYFMIRIRRLGDGASEPNVSGVVERIGTGEKRSFASSDELLRFMGGHDTPIGRIPAAAAPRNTSDTGSPPGAR